MSHRILLVDDEVDILEFVRYNLVREGYEVFTAENGAEALKVAAECRPHLILLDMMMPVMNKVVESKVFLTKNGIPVETIQGAKVTDVKDLLSDGTDEVTEG